MKVIDTVKPLPKDDWGKSMAYIGLANAILEGMKSNAKRIEVKHV